MLNTKLRGAFLVSQAVARHIRDTGRGGSSIDTVLILALRLAGQISAYTS